MQDKVLKISRICWRGTKSDGRPIKITMLYRNMGNEYLLLLLTASCTAEGELLLLSQLTFWLMESQCRACISRGRQHADYQSKTPYPGLESSPRTRLNAFIICGLSATGLPPPFDKCWRKHPLQTIATRLIESGLPIDVIVRCTGWIRLPWGGGAGRGDEVWTMTMRCPSPLRQSPKTSRTGWTQRFWNSPRRSLSCSG